MALTERLAIILETIGARGVISDFDRVGEAADRLGRETTGASTGITEMGVGLGRMGGVLSRGTVAIGAIGAVAGVAGKQLFDFGQQAIDAASGFEESVNKANVVFGQNSAVIHDWAMSAAEDFGLSQRAATEAAGTFGNMFSAMGIGATASLEMSQSIVELAADIASFNNLPIPDVLDRLRSGLLGEQEAVERLGINMSETRIKAEGLAMGIGDGTRLLNAQEKAMVAYRIILDDTATAQGDFDRTSGSLANQQRILSANWENMQAELGQKLLPVMTSLVEFLNEDGIPAMVGFAEVVGEGIADAAAFGTGALADLLSVFGQALEKIDQFVPGMEGIPEELEAMAAGIRNFEADAHNFHIELDGLAAASNDTSSGLAGAMTSAQGFAGALGDTAVQADAAADAIVRTKDASFALTDANMAHTDALDDLADAQDEYNKLLATNGIDADKVEQATLGLVTANENVAAAMAEVVDWQTKVQKALDPADPKDLAKAQREAEEATDDVAKAEIALAEAQAYLNGETRDGRLTADEYELAKIAVRDAERNLADAQDNAAEKQAELTALQLEGTTLSADYKEATAGLGTAQGNLATAEQAAADAQSALNAAQIPGAGFAEELAAAETKVEDAEWRVEKAAWAAEKAQMAFNTAVSAENAAKVQGMADATWSLSDALSSLPDESSGIWGTLGSLAAGVGGGQTSGNGSTGTWGGGGGGGIWGTLNDRIGTQVIQVVVDGQVLTEVVHNGLLAKQRKSGNLGFN